MLQQLHLHRTSMIDACIFASYDHIYDLHPIVNYIYDHSVNVYFAQYTEREEKQGIYLYFSFLFADNNDHVLLLAEMVNIWNAIS